jgi:hypothetical protein
MSRISIARPTTISLWGCDMAQYIPQRDEAGSIVGMSQGDGRSQVASLVEETMKAVGATNPTPPPPRQHQRQSPRQTIHQQLPPLDNRTIAAIAVLGVLFIVMIFSLVNQILVRSAAVLPTAIVSIATPSATPPIMPTRVPALVEQSPSPVPSAPPVSQGEPVAQGQPPPIQPEIHTPDATPTDGEDAPVVAVQVTADTQATADAWVKAPPSTATPSPGPGDPGFAESFQPQPECNIFIGYVGEKRAYCNGVYATQTAQAEP